MSGNAETFAKLKLSGTCAVRPVRGRWPVAAAVLAGGNDRADRPEQHPQRRQEPLPGIQEDSRAAGRRRKDADRAVGMEPDGPDPQQGQGPVRRRRRRKSCSTQVQGTRRFFSDQHEYMWPVASMLLGYQEPFKMNKAQLDKAKDILIRIKRNAPSVTRAGTSRCANIVEETVWIGMSSPGRAMTIQAAGGPTDGLGPAEGRLLRLDRRRHAGQRLAQSRCGAGLDQPHPQPRVRCDELQALAARARPIAAGSNCSSSRAWATWSRRT